MTVAAVVALLIGVGNLIALVVGVKVQGKVGRCGAGFILLSSIFLSMAWGLWRVKYWAARMQALLGITLVFAFLSLLLTGAWETVPSPWPRSGWPAGCSGSSSARWRGSRCPTYER